MRLIFSPKYAPDIGDHVFPTKKFVLTAEALNGKVPFAEPEPPSREDLLLAHDEAWADKVLSRAMTLEDETRMELPFTEEVSLAHRLGAAGTILACRDALESGIGLHAGGGSHHAFADRGEGFCVLNDIAIGILKMRVERRIKRAAVVDLDVHQGNGTAAIFAKDPAVFTFSIHQENLYPVPKEKSSLDVGLAEGTKDAEYLEILGKNLPKVFAHGPQLVVYQAGVDCGEKDLLGGLKLTKEGLLRRDELVFAACRERGVACAVTLGGGYSGDIKETAALHVQTLLAGMVK